MKKNNTNICKFVPYINDERIITSNFVYERSLELSSEKKALKSNVIYLVTSGEGFLNTDVFRKALKPGTLFFTFSGTPFCIENTKDIEYSYITFKGTRSDILFERSGIMYSNCVFDGYEGLISFWENAIGKADEKNLDLISESVLLYTFAHLCENDTSRGNGIINDILKLVDSEFTDSTLCLESVSEQVGYSSKYISRIFKDSVGITFSEYLRNTRIRHSIFLIEQNIISVKNIAFLSGYSDPLYFSNVFKKTVGISPTEYMKRNL